MAPSSGAISERPVMLPPGRARLATMPSPTGSELTGITIGIVRVASRAASTAGDEKATSTSTFIFTSPAASAGMRSSISSAHLASASS